jgi:hypothetical protein
LPRTRFPPDRPPAEQASNKPFLDLQNQPNLPFWQKVNTK